MSNPIEAFIPGIESSRGDRFGHGGLGGVAGGAKFQQQQEGSRSFESVLQQGSRGGSTAEASGVPAVAVAPGAATGTSGAAIEKLRVELMERISELPSGARQASVLLPELLESGSRLKLLREAVQGTRNVPMGTDLRGRFGQVEREWFDLERLMRSDKDLSTGELLGLQARLYQVSQHIEVMSKVVDQMTSGVKSILNTNV